MQGLLTLSNSRTLRRLLILSASLSLSNSSLDPFDRKTSMEKSNDLPQANILISTALQKAKEAKTFVGRWKTIASMIEILPACLSDLSTHPCLPKLSIYHKHLQSICQTLNQVIHLAQQDNLGKLQTQSQLHSLSSLLAMNIKDCKLLTKSAILGDFSTWELLARLEIGHTEAKFQAIEALLEAVTADEKRVSSVLSRSHASALVHLLNSSPTPKLKEKTTMVICLLADSRNSAEMLVSEGAIPPLIRVARSNGVVFCRNKAVVSLQRLSLLPDAARSIVSHGGGSILMEICREGEDVASRVAAAGALKNLAAIAELQAELGREGIIRVMLHLLDSSNPPECREHAAECMQNLTAGELSTAAAVAAALPKLLSFIDETAAPPAIAAVGNLVGTLPPAELISADLLPRLVGILRRGSPAAQQLAAAALQKASSKSATIKRLAGESGCISLLVNLLSSKNEDMKTYSASAMATLMQHLPNATTAKKDPRTVPTLIPLLSSAAATEHAISCLLALSTSHKSKKLMISHGAITKLSSIAISPNSRELLYRLQRLKLKKELQGG